MDILECCLEATGNVMLFFFFFNLFLLVTYKDGTLSCASVAKLEQCFGLRVALARAAAG